MKLTKNQKQIYSMMFNLYLESIKVFMGCLLIMFVPQKCNDHVCSMQEKLEDSRYYWTFVLNVLTLLVFLKSYHKEYRREKFIINHFDINKKLPDNNLRLTTSQNPAIMMKLLTYNEKFYKYTLFAIITGLINFACSSGVIIFNHYAGYKTVVSLMTNVLLISKTISSNYHLSKESYDKRLALSTSVSEAVSYNQLEPRFAITIEPQPEQV